MYLVNFFWLANFFVQKDSKNNICDKWEHSLIEDCIIRPSVYLTVAALLTSAEAMNE